MVASRPNDDGANGHGAATTRTAMAPTMNQTTGCPVSIPLVTDWFHTLAVIGWSSTICGWDDWTTSYMAGRGQE